MLTICRILATVSVVIGAFALSSSMNVSVAEEVCVYDPDTQIWQCSDSDEDGEGGSGGEGSDGGGAVPSCFHDGEQIPCSTQWGYWSDAYGCYIRLAEPQPPYDHPVWDGRTDGAVYVCTPPESDSCDPAGGGCGNDELIWSPTPPPATPPIDPEDLAREAIAIMQLRPLEINMAPPTLSDDPDSMVPVGLPVWIWTDPTDQSWGPITRSASDRGLTVSVTAHVTRAEWDMGDGETVTCRDPGTPYQTSYGVGQESPSCGHRYDETSRSQPGDSYEITASSYWVANWSGGGQMGELLFRIDNSDLLRVGEIQAIRVE